ncbi:MAG: tRNA (N6-threonylcarbamoyladenosine(37)-N6)-methyltransferase TrmO [Desulfomonile tiedjei]|nr:tRNA (N6-threonylcarbamoyladenosine(37)-N6)-methyltransferase TrmO [Desulfomonile tiedjei]
MHEIVYKPIGIVRSPFKDVEGMPIQAKAAAGIRGTVELNPDLVTGLKDLEGFSHIILIYHFHGFRGYSLEVRPFLDDSPRGVFATRAPRRPNAIGISVVRLDGIIGTTLHVQDIDILDGTPVLDIKPFVPEFDNRQSESVGWLNGKLQEADVKKSDRRFEDQ